MAQGTQGSLPVSDIGWPGVDKDLRDNYARNRGYFFVLGPVLIAMWIGVVTALLFAKDVDAQVAIALAGSVTTVVVGGLFAIGRALPLRLSR